MPTGRRGRLLALILLLDRAGRRLSPGRVAACSTSTRNAQPCWRTGACCCRGCAPPRTSCPGCAPESSSCARLPAPARSLWRAPATRSLRPALQSRIEELAASVGATIGSTESLPAEARSGYRRIGLRYVLSGPYETLVKFLAKLEAATPPLVIDNLHIHGVLRRPGTPAAAGLDAGLDVYGLPRRRKIGGRQAMIDRLVLLLLIGGCLLFGAIVFIELEPAGADGCGGRQGCGAARYRADHAPAAEPEARGAAGDSPRPTAVQQHAASSAECVQRSRGRLRSRRYAADRDRHRARAPYRDLRRQRRQAAEGRGGRRRQRLADREHHAARGLVERPERNQDLAAKARSEPRPAAWATADRSTPAGECRLRPPPAGRALLCRARPPAVAAAAARCPGQYSRRATAASAAAPAAMMSTPATPCGRSPSPSR